MIQCLVFTSDSSKECRCDATAYLEQLTSLEMQAFIDSNGEDFAIALHMAEQVMDPGVVEIFDHVSRFNGNHASGHISVRCRVNPREVRTWRNLMSGRKR